MLKNNLLLLFTFVLFAVNAQHKNILLNNFYKNEFLRYSKNKSIETFFPANEAQINLTDSIKDTTVFYYDLPIWFFQKHWLEVKQKDGKINVSPLVDFSYGKNFNPLNEQTLFRNTRGFFMEGELLNKISFNFLLSENQAAFMDYEARYFDSNGELYVNPNGGYQRVNAVIPSGARTKPFKTGVLVNAYDYAFSMGSIAWNIRPKVRIEAGNTPHFIGVGYRSLLLSDNSIHSPFVRINWKINAKWSYQFVSKKHQNLFRKPKTFGIESPYENKLFTVSYLTFKPKENLSISLFTSGNQLRADSIVKFPIQVSQFLPIFNNDLAYSSSKVNGISGLNIDFALKHFRYYSQIVLDKMNKTYISAFQLGVLGFNLFKIKNLDFQIEYNFVPENFYASSDVKLAYSHSNLPSAHPKGNDFQELMLQVQFSWKRFNISLLQHIYFTKGYSELEQYQANSISEIDKISPNFVIGTTYVSQGEIAYRFNNKYNACLYVQTKYRMAEFGTYISKNWMFLGGLKVALFNQYFDF